MDLDQQIQNLVDNAPKDGTTPEAIKAIAPVLKTFAEQLSHPQYYVLQTIEQNWVMTTLNHRNQAEQKKVIYAYPTLKDVSSAPYSLKDPQLVAMPVPVTHILFQMVAMTTLDSAVFFETPGNPNKGTEVRRSDLQNLIQAQLQNLKVQTNLPPDIA